MLFSILLNVSKIIRSFSWESDKIVKMNPVGGVRIEDKIRIGIRREISGA